MLPILFLLASLIFLKLETSTGSALGAELSNGILSEFHEQASTRLHIRS